MNHNLELPPPPQALSENPPDWRVVDDANRCYLMRARSEWPRGHAAQRPYEFSATKVECHVTPPEVRDSGATPDRPVIPGLYASGPHNCGI